MVDAVVGSTRRRKRGRGRRYDPQAEPVRLPEGFVDKLRTALQMTVDELRGAVSWLDGEVGTPLIEMTVDLRMNRAYGEGDTPDVDDVVVTVRFDDRGGGRNYQRFTWVYADTPTEDQVRVRGHGRRLPGRRLPGRDESPSAGESPDESSVAPDVEHKEPTLAAAYDRGGEEVEAGVDVVESDLVEVASGAVVVKDQRADTPRSPGALAGITPPAPPSQLIITHIFFGLRDIRGGPRSVSPGRARWFSSRARHRLCGGGIHRGWLRLAGSRAPFSMAAVF
jgi:hypothetical protein